MNERTCFFIKIYLSHFILERVDVGCVWEVSWRWGQTATYWPQVLLTIAALLSHSGWARSPPSAAGSQFSILSPTDSNCNWNSNWLKLSVAPGYIFVWCPPASCGRTHLPPSLNSTTSTGQGDILIYSIGCTCFTVLPLIYTGASLDWWLGRGSICYILNFLNWKSNYCIHSSNEQSLIFSHRKVFLSSIVCNDCKL